MYLEIISFLINIFTLLAECLLSTLLVLTLTMRELHHWPSPQSHYGDEEDGYIGLSSWRHYIYIYYAPYFVDFEHSVCHEPIFVLIIIFTRLAKCLLSTLLVLRLTKRDLRYWSSVKNNNNWLLHCVSCINFSLQVATIDLIFLETKIHISK